MPAPQRRKPSLIPGADACAKKSAPSRREVGGREGGVMAPCTAAQAPEGRKRNESPRGLMRTWMLLVSHAGQSICLRKMAGIS